MNKRFIKLVCVTASLLAVAFLMGTTTARADHDGMHHPIYMPNVNNIGNPALQPPPICCLPGSPFAPGVPVPPNMGYYGGHVEVTPKI